MTLTKKLGRLPARHDPRTLHLARYLEPAALSVPSSNDNTPPDPLGMMMNDSLGDCGFAAQGHAVQTWTNKRGSEVTPSDADVVTAYEVGAGYVAGNPATDNGVVLLDALASWQKNGIAGRTITAYVRVDPKNLPHVKAAQFLFGGVYIGAGLPLSAQGQSSWIGKVPRKRHHLTGSDAPGSWGGHCMFAPQYDSTGGTFITWGARQRFDWQWWLDYVDEAYAVLSPDWVTGAIPGFDLATLQQDLAAL